MWNIGIYRSVHICNRPPIQSLSAVIAVVFTTIAVTFSSSHRCMCPGETIIQPIVLRKIYPVQNCLAEIWRTQPHQITYWQFRTLHCSDVSSGIYPLATLLWVNWIFWINTWINRILKSGSKLHSTDMLGTSVQSLNLRLLLMIIWNVNARK